MRSYTLKELNGFGNTYGFRVYTHSPGDGVTRYRFSNDMNSQYFACTAIYTALGRSEATVFLNGLLAGIFKMEDQQNDR